MQTEIYLQRLTTVFWNLYFKILKSMYTRAYMLENKILRLGSAYATFWVSQPQNGSPGVFSHYYWVHQKTLGSKDCENLNFLRLKDNSAAIGKS